MVEVTPTQDIIDSRDVEELIDDLQDEQDSLVDEYTEARDEAEDDDEAEGVTERLSAAINALADYWDVAPEEVDDCVAALANEADGFNGNEELHKLKAFRSELEGYCDWTHGETLIRETYFVEYVQELVSDTGDMPREIPSYIAIDWERTANNLKIDYTEGDFDGVTYLVRCH
jgi:hypothetical protein